MGKLILLLSILATAILFSLPFIDPSNSIMWLASVEANFTYLRLIMLIILVSLLATHPPRHLWLRFLVGSFAIAIASWAVWQTYFWSMNILDILSILQFSIATGVIILESKQFPLEPIGEDERLVMAHQARMTIMQPSIFNSRR